MSTTTNPEVREEPSYDQLLSQVPAKLRPKVAEARNLKVRSKRSYDEYLENTRAFRALIRSLVYRYGMSKKQVARLMELSDTRIDQITRGKN